VTVWKIWQAQKLDAPLLAALERAAFGPKSWGGESVMATFNARHVVVHFGGAEIDVPLGFAIWRAAAADEGEILSIGVTPAARRQGLAGALLLALLKSARESGVSRLFLEVDNANIAAIGLYEAFGFAQIAERAGYYRDGADALIMRKNLTE